MWAALGLDGLIDHACDVDLAGEAVLEFLLKQENLVPLTSSWSQKT